MRRTAILAFVLALTGHAAYSQNGLRDVSTVSGRALVCRNPYALQALSEPDAEARMGHINYLRAVTEGQCIEIDDAYRLRAITNPGAPVSTVWQGAGGSSMFIMSRDIVDERR